MKTISTLIFLMLIFNIVASYSIFGPTTDCPYVPVPPGCILDDDCHIACYIHASIYDECDDYNYYGYCQDY